MSKRKLVVTMAALAMAGGVALAVNAHFTKVSATLQGNDVGVCWKEAGLGDNQNIDYVASANATATYVCVNNGGQCPNAANKITVSGPVTARGTFQSGKNGNITACLTLTPPGPGGFSCPSGQTLTLSQVSYSGIQIKDTTNNVTETAPPGSISATPFVCP